MLFNTYILIWSNIKEVMVMIKYSSKISKGSSEIDSVRVVIPQGLRKILELNPGDRIDWIVNIEDNGIKVTVEKKSD